jgi:dipeptide/tripeptide permease
MSAAEAAEEHAQFKMVRSMNPFILATLPYIRETVTEVILSHLFMATLFISVFAALGMANMAFHKPKQELPSRRKALAICVTTLMFPTGFLVADLSLAALDGIPVTNLVSTNVFSSMLFGYLVFLMMYGGIWFRAIRKFPTEQQQQDKMPPMQR